MENIPQIPSRNLDELKRQIVQNLDKNGKLGELRSEIKLEIFKIIENKKINLKNNFNSINSNNLKYFELIAEFLKFHNLKDSLNLFLYETNLNKIRPTEIEVSQEFNLLNYSNNTSILEQLIHPESSHHHPPQSRAGDYNIHIPAQPPRVDISDNSLESDIEKIQNLNNFNDNSNLSDSNIQPVPIWKPKHHRISSDEIEEDIRVIEQNSPRYDEDFEEDLSESSPLAGITD
jgi:hypothetical protein